MSLSNKAVNVLAKVVASDVADDILMSEEWVTLCHELVPALITEKLGEVEEDLLYELALCVMDRIVVKAV